MTVPAPITRELKKDDEVILRAGMNLRCGEQTLNFASVDAASVGYYYQLDPDATMDSATRDVSKGDVDLSQYTDMKGRISKRENGEIVYTHQSDTPAVLQDVQPLIVIASEGGAGAGATRANHSSERGDNFDRYTAQAVPEKNDAQALEFLDDIISEADVRTARMKAGSTLSIAMKTTDGHFACAHIGDSPLFMFGEDKDKQAVLVPVSVPQNMNGLAVRTKEGIRLGENIVKDPMALVAAYQQHMKKNTADRRLVEALGLMGRSEAALVNAELYIIDPAQLPPDVQWKGMLVCSDGIEPSLANRTLRATIEKNLSLGPQALAGKIADVAAQYGSDDITAMVLPMDGKGLIAVADGNKGSPEVADATIECIREACKEKGIGGGFVEGVKQSRAGDEMGRW